MRQSDSATPAKPGERLKKTSGWIAGSLAVAGFSLTMFATVSGYELPGKPGWSDAALLLTATLATLIALTRHLPLQNVLLTAVVIASIGSAAHALCVMTAMPFGPMNFLRAGPKVFGVLPWAVPLLWIVAILNSRGVARLILRPWRKLRAYGFWLIGLTAALTMLFDFALEPFAAKVKFFWVWQETKFPVSWYGAPLVNFLGWLATSLLILAFAAPALINKHVQPRQLPPDYQPLIVWGLALSLFATAAAVEKFWPACIASALIAAVVAIFAIRGARW